jgi:hypothetical protein
MSDNEETVSVPVKLLRSILMDYSPENYVWQEVDTLIPKPKPRLVAVDLDQIVRRGSHGEIMLYSDLENQPDLLTVLDEAIDGALYLPRVRKDFKARIYAALGVDQ